MAMMRYSFDEMNMVVMPDEWIQIGQITHSHATVHVFFAIGTLYDNLQMKNEHLLRVRWADVSNIRHRFAPHVEEVLVFLKDAARV